MITEIFQIKNCYKILFKGNIHGSRQLIQGRLNVLLLPVAYIYSFIHKLLTHYHVYFTVGNHNIA